MPKHQNKDPIIISGMHRSGTELLSRLFVEAGVFMGNDLDVHGESNTYKNINRQLLKSKKAHWANPDPYLQKLSSPEFVERNVNLASTLIDDNFEQYGLEEACSSWGWKDPRNTITLPIWLQIYPHAKVIHVIRNGISVSLSLCRREQRRFFRMFIGRSKENLMFPPTLAKAYQLWEIYVRVGRELCQSKPNCYLIRYEDLIEKPVSSISYLFKSVNIPYDDRMIQSLSDNIIRPPSRPTNLERFEVNLALRLRWIKPTLMSELGYSL